MRHLTLAVDNTLNKSLKTQEDVTLKKTCRTHCLLFDEETEQCAEFRNVNVDNPKTVARCQRFINGSLKDSFDDGELVLELIEEDWTAPIKDKEFAIELMGEKFDFTKSTYPEKPDFPSEREDAIWYVAPDKSFGCWIVNESNRKCLAVGSKVATGWTDRVYKSPIPLHDHNSSLPVKSRMCWFVDRDGYGQYVLLVKGDVEFTTAPKPKNWGN